jgi:TRAP-type uncharacterized transport system fused permease subunit
MTAATELDEKKVQELEEKFDPEMRFRPVVPPASLIVKWLLVALSCFHYYTAGFGLLRETTHRGIHLAFVLGLIFLVFAANPKSWDKPRRSSWSAPAAFRSSTGCSRSRSPLQSSTSRTSSKT